MDETSLYSTLALVAALAISLVLFARRYVRPRFEYRPGSMNDLHQMVEHAKSLCGNAGYDDLQTHLKALIHAADYSLRGPEITQGLNIAIWRVRPCENDELFTDLNQCTHPPPDHAKLNRANLPGKPVLYTSGNWGTALSELEPELGQVVTVAGFLLKKNLPTLVVGDLQRIRFSRNPLLAAEDNRDAALAAYDAMSSNERDRAVYVDSYFADQFRITSSDVYPLTACLASLIWRSNSHALWYPSVKAGAGLNLAVPAPLVEEYLYIGIVKAFRINEVYGHGAYGYDIIASAVSVTASTPLG